MSRLMDFMDTLLGTLQVVGVVAISLPALLLPLTLVGMLGTYVTRKYLLVCGYTAIGAIC